MAKTPFSSPLNDAIPEQLDILYQDAHLIAVHKPAGLLVHKSPIDKHETRYAMKLLRNQIGQWVYPVHRLDKPTSGLLLFALQPETARQVSSEFEQQSVAKDYLAIVRGYIPEFGEISHPLKEIAAFKHLQHAADEKQAKTAVTIFQCLMRYELPYSDGRFETSRYSLVKLQPRSGRKHQIRRHLKHISHPIVGDVKYGKGEHNRLFKRVFNNKRLLLAAQAMTLNHPETGQRLHLQCPLAYSFTSVINQLAEFERTDIP